MESFLLKLSLLFVIFTLPNLYAVLPNVVVMDDILTPKNLKFIEIFLSSEETRWNFIDLISQRILNVSDTHYWTAKFENLASIRNSTWSVRIQQQVALKLGITVDFLHVTQVSAQISGRGDNTLVSNSCTRMESNERQDMYVVIVFSTIRNWNRNSYGELVVYDKDGEILKSTHPRNGRVVLLGCDYSYIIKPPSMDCTERLQTLTINFSISTPLTGTLEESPNVKDNTSRFLHSTYAHHRELINSLVDRSNHTKLDVAKYVTRQFKTIKGHPIFVIDNIIPTNILDFFADLIVNGTYTNDPPSPDSGDNVPWILAFDTDSVVKSPLWNYIKRIAKFASRKDGLYPYDVSCNVIRSYDTTTVHTDCASDQEEFTLLIYLNKNWTNNHIGETVFFDYDTDEMLFAIKPKYGRIAIFHGTIPHSARPPTPLFHGSRYTLAIKFALSKDEAFRKALAMEVEPLERYLENCSPDDHEVIEVQRFLDDIKSGKKSPEEIENIIKKYEKKLQEM